VTVLDASALLAFLFSEAGADEVAELVETSCLSTVNLAEVLGRFARDGHDCGLVRQRLEATSLEIVPFSPRQAEAAAKLVPACRPLGLSLGDRACIALALERGVPALTADRTWLDLDVPVQLRVIR
jgi:PIN domain nuclease of toxin-antitoxin system